MMGGRVVLAVANLGRKGVDGSVQGGKGVPEDDFCHINITE